MSYPVPWNKQQQQLKQVILPRFVKKVCSLQTRSAQQAGTAKRMCQITHAASSAAAAAAADKAVPIPTQFTQQPKCVMMNITCLLPADLFKWLWKEQQRLPV
jgi:hypothetical protein